MSKIGLFVRHRAKPGMRPQVEEIWAKYVKPRVESSSDHEAYYFCHDEDDEDVVCVFQLFSHVAAVDEFMAGEWYPHYLAEIAEVVAEAPQINRALPAWIKS